MCSLTSSQARCVQGSSSTTPAAPGRVSTVSRTRTFRAAGEGYLLLGWRRERFSARELPDHEKEQILRAYLRKWKWEVGQFFDGVGPDAPTEELHRIAPDHPVFRIESHE